MKRTMLLCLVALFALVGVAPAQEQEVEGITHGQFAVLLLKAAAGYTDALPDEVTALEQVKGYGLVPESWAVDDVLTYGELSEVLARFGVTFTYSDPDSPVAPVVATAVGGTTEILTDRASARLVPPNDVDALAGAMRELLQDCTLRHRLGRRARQQVIENFALPAAAKRMRAFWESCLGGI